MPRDRKTKDSFNPSPFRTLKGLPVSCVPKKSPPTPVPTSVVTPADGDDSELFAREMNSLDVRPLTGAQGAGAGRETAPAAPSPASSTDEGSAEFLAALGNLDKTFRDELPVGEESNRARLRRMKQLERGELTPSGQLDLHGLIRDEALARTRAFLAHAARQGWPLVLIVTGKGLHSSEGPVLRRAVERLLGEAGELVLEWGEAPRRFGGAGALAVFVRVVK